jgi:hypothetical protein
MSDTLHMFPGQSEFDTRMQYAKLDSWVSSPGGQQRFREAMLGQRPMWIRLKSRRRLNLLRLLQLVQVGVRDEIIFPKTMKSPKQFLRVTVDHRRRANLAKAKLRPGQAPLQGRVGRRCCWIYRLTVARLAPPVEPAK